MHFVVAVVAALAIAVQSGQDPLLSRLAGQWTGTGTVLNQPSTIEMAWSWELGGRFMRLTFRNEMGTAPKINVFEGHAYYRPTADGHYRGMWFDNGGMQRPLDATLKWIKDKFGKRPETMEANTRALKAGYNYGETVELLPVQYQVAKAQISPGTYRKITGNEAAVIGRVFEAADEHAVTGMDAHLGGLAGA